jgi:D-arabinose 1-dehydrogenase-like Zn-dependent alcohol dehydrogenase
MSCAGVTAYSAIKRANLKPGDVSPVPIGTVDY